MRQRVTVASCLLFLLFHRFSNVDACGEASIQPLAGDATVHERAFELDAQGRVIGGTVARTHAWPWMVLLIYESSVDRRTYMCGATVISDEWLMTAAHCAIAMNVARTTAYVGIQSQREAANSMGRSIQTKIVHPSYNTNTYVNDIALLKLSSKLSFNSNVQPICVPATSEDSTLIQTEQYGYATGWGQYTNNGVVQPGSSVDLRQAELPFIDPEICRRKWPTTGDQICAGAYLKGTGQGDSGGPLEVQGTDKRWYQVGITSYGSNTNQGLIDQQTYPGVYTRVSQYYSFIQKYVKFDDVSTTTTRDATMTSPSSGICPTVTCPPPTMCPTCPTLTCPRVGSSSARSDGFLRFSQFSLSISLIVILYCSINMQFF